MSEPAKPFLPQHNVDLIYTKFLDTIIRTNHFNFQIAGVLTLPFDVIKTHRQMELGQVVLTHGKSDKISIIWFMI